MPPTIPIEELRAELGATLKEVSRLALICSHLERVIDIVRDQNPADLAAYLTEYRAQLKLQETRKAQLQDELERTTKCELRPDIGLCDSCSLPKWPQEHDGYGSMICADCLQKEQPTHNTKQNDNYKTYD